MPLDPSIALGGQRPAQQQDPLAGLASLMQLVHVVQQNRKLDAEAERLGQRTPLELALLRAQTENQQSQVPQHQAAAVKAQLETAQRASEMQGQRTLLDLINPRSDRYTQFQGGPAPQMADSEGDALQRMGYRLNADGTVTPLPNSEQTRNTPQRTLVPNHADYNMALLQADPKTFLTERIKAQNSPEQFASATPGSQVYSRRTGAMAGPQVPFAERAPQAPVVRPVPDASSATGYSYQDMRNPGSPLAPAPAPATQGRQRPAPANYMWDEDGSKVVPIPGGPADPENPAVGSREAVFTGRMLLGANQASKALENITKLPIMSDTGIFGGRQQGKGLMEATKEVLAQKVTSQEAQTYNVMTTGLQRSLAAIEAAGLMPSGSLTHQMDAVLLKAGDTHLTKIIKLAETRQIVEAGLETTLASPRLPKSQRDHANELLAKIRTAVPFTPYEASQLVETQATNPTATMRSLLDKAKTSPAPAAAGGLTPAEEARYQELLRKQSGAQ